MKGLMKASFRAQPWGDWLASIHEVFCCPALWWTLLVLFSLSSKVAHFFPATFSDGQCPLSHHPLSGMGLQVPASFCSFSSPLLSFYLTSLHHSSQHTHFRARRGVSFGSCLPNKILYIKGTLGWVSGPRFFPRLFFLFFPFCFLSL